MKILALILTALFVTPVFAQETSEPRTFEAYEGVINLDAFASEISKKLNEEVELQSMRSTYDPILRAGNYFGVFDTFYVVNFTINSQHEISCSVSIDLQKDTTLLYSCKSETAKVSVGYIPNPSIGIPINPNKLQHFGN